jgi:tRNA 5-methylaminomethyl-2-thiouridine biosynthesis bifunctional protein
VTLVERHHAPAQEASGNHAGAFHPLITRDDSHAARLSRAAFSWLLEHWRQLDAIGASPEWARCGLLQLARDAREDAAQRARVGRRAAARIRAVFSTPAQAGAPAPGPARRGGLWFPEGGWIRPASLRAR